MPWPKGKPRSDETKQKISCALKGKGKGKVFSDTHRANLSRARQGKVPWNKGKPCSEETKQKISEALTGRIITAEWRENISRANKGQPKPPRSEEHRQKLGEAHKGKPRSEETKQKISEKLKGRTFSAEHRTRISKAVSAHPRTEEHCHNLSQALEGHILSDQHRQKLSEASRKAWARGAWDNRSVASFGAAYGGIDMHSSWEVRLARVFDAFGWQWEYEPCSFQYQLGGGQHTYTPDFYVKDTDCYFDPHSFYWKDNNDKFNAIRKQCHIHLIVLTEDVLLRYEGVTQGMGPGYGNTREHKGEAKEPL